MKEAKKMDITDFEKSTGIDMNFEWYDVNINYPGETVDSISGDEIVYEDISMPINDLYNVKISLKVEDFDGVEAIIPMVCTMKIDGSCEDIDVLINEIENKEFVKKHGL